MAPLKNVDQDRGGWRNGRAGVRELGRGHSGALWQALVRAGFEVINREALCAALALVFTFTVVIPSILIFGDRSLPFQYIDAAMVDQVAVPGQRVHVRYTVAKVSKDCSGTVQRYFFDGAGRVFFLGEAPAVYYRVVSDPVAGTFEMPWVVPLEAAPGDGLYVAYVEFWCNKVQALFPIKAPPQKARVTVLMPNRASGN